MFIVVIEFLSGDGSEFYCGGAGVSINFKSFRDLYGGQAPVVCYIEHQKESKTLVSQHWRFNSGSSKGSVVEKHKAIASVLSKRPIIFFTKYQQMFHFIFFVLVLELEEHVSLVQIAAL